METISVIIVSWNTVDFLRQCLKSIISGTHQHPVEIIVVDNGSTDGSPEAVQREFPNVALIQNGCNLGFAKANNIGLKRSTGRYVCLINSDVVVFEGCLDRMYIHMDQHSSVGVLGPQILNADSTLQRSCRQFPSLWNTFCRTMAFDTVFASWRLFGGYLMTFWAHDTVRGVDVLSGSFWMVRREVLNDVGFLDEDFFIYGEDMDFCKRCRSQAWDIVYLPDAKAVHYGAGSSSRFPVRFEVENLKATLQYWRKHHGRLAQVAFVVIRLCLHVRRMITGMALYVFKPSEKRFFVEFKVNVACVLWLLQIPASGPTRHLMGECQ